MLLGTHTVWSISYDKICLFQYFTKKICTLDKLSIITTKHHLMLYLTLFDKMLLVLYFLAPTGAQGITIFVCLFVQTCLKLSIFIFCQAQVQVR